MVFVAQLTGRCGDVKHGVIKSRSKTGKYLMIAFEIKNTGEAKTGRIGKKRWQDNLGRDFVVFDRSSGTVWRYYGTLRGKNRGLDIARASIMQGGLTKANHNAREIVDGQARGETAHVTKTKQSKTRFVRKNGFFEKSFGIVAQNASGSRYCKKKTSD